MDDNMNVRLEIARRIYDLDAEVYKVLGSSLGRVFNGDRDMTVRRLANLMCDFTQGHYLRPHHPRQGGPLPADDRVQ